MSASICTEVLLASDSDLVHDAITVVSVVSNMGTESALIQT